MLKGIDPLLSADLLHLLASMGHGDDLALVDANHPAAAVAAATTSGRLIRLPGVRMERAARTILSVFPLDDFVDDPVRRMTVVGDEAQEPEVQRQVRAEVDRAAGREVTVHGQALGELHLIFEQLPAKVLTLNELGNCLRLSKNF